jgi:predicted GNAT superfamily acetyltransferase
MPEPLSERTIRAAKAAWGSASDAAQAAGVEMGLLLDATEARRTAELFAEVWGVTDGPVPVSGDLIRALVHTGNYAAGAWAGPELVGASVAFLALDDGRLSLHSHITGVARAARGSSVGFALKQHQRAWALSHGIDEITWTFDPLVRGNARFNLVKLGALAVAYLFDFYGQMQDGINAGDRSDRCAVRWSLYAPRTVAAGDVAAATDVARPGDIPTAGDMPRAGQPPAGGKVLLAVGPDDAPVLMDADESTVSSTTTVLCQVPADIVAMRAADPGKARAWREALGDTMGATMEAGFFTGFITRDGWYVLTRTEDEESD